MKGKKLATAAAVFCLTLLLAPAVAFAPQEAHAGETGDFTVTGGTSGTDYSYENNVLTIKTSTPLTISMATSGATTTTDRIVVTDGVSAYITLAGVSIDRSRTGTGDGGKVEVGVPAFEIANSSSGNVTVVLADGSVNVLKGGYQCAGLQKNGISSNGTAVGTLTIKGGTNGTGSLSATGGTYGAGIGGGYQGSASGITIAGGVVTATGGSNAPGIGGGSQGACSDVRITGGSVRVAGNPEGSTVEIPPIGSGWQYGGNPGVPETPTLDGVTPVYLLEFVTDGISSVTIDKKTYPAQHSYCENGEWRSESKVYAYVTGANHMVKVGTAETAYHFDSFSGTFHLFKSDYASDNAGHWRVCSVDGCIVTADPSAHDYEWQDGGSQYWQECFVCGHETAKKDIPTITINGADEVCRTQDYSFSFTLPQGTTLVGACYYPGESEQPISLSQSEGVYSGVVLAKDHSPFPAASNFEVRVKAETSDDYEFTVTKTVTSRSEHAYEWQDGGGQYWQECSVCGHETAKEDIPSITITGADAVCRTQDYSFSVLLPEGVTVTSWSYEFEGKGDGFLVPEGKMGVFSATVPASVYEDEGSFKVAVAAKTSDGFVFSFDKVVVLQSEHAGGTANCMHKAVCSTCGDEYGELGAHSLTHVAAKEATADVEGNIEYWRCETCGKLFSDAQGKSEIALADTVVKNLQKSDAPEKTAKTGDSVNVAFWLTLLSVASVALAVACIRNVRGRVR